MSGVATNGMCWQGALDVLSMLASFARTSMSRQGLVEGGKRRQVVLYERGTFFVKNYISKGAHALLTMGKHHIRGWTSRRSLPV